MLWARFALGAGLFAWLSGSGAAFAGAWTLPAGKGQLILTSLASFAAGAFGSGSAREPAPDHQKFEAQALLEYGVTDRFTAIAMPSLQEIAIATPTAARRRGLGYSEFGGRYRVFEFGGWVASGQASVRIPGTNATSNPAALGYTDPEFDIRALIGTSFGLFGFPAFANIEAAHRVRGGRPPDELRADITFGVQASSRLLLLLQSYNVISEGAGAPPFASYAYAKLQVSAVYALTPSLSLQAGAVTTYTGHNALQENALVFGVWYRF